MHSLAFNLHFGMLSAANRQQVALAPRGQNMGGGMQLFGALNPREI